MGSLIFTTKFNKNDGLVISPKELIEMYFFGIKMVDTQGNVISQHVIKKFIRASQEEVEKWLNIKLQRQIVREVKDYFRSDWYAWGYVRTTYPAVEVRVLDGFIGETKQISYPKEWLSVRQTNDGELYHRHIYLVPSTNSPTNHQVVFTGITPHIALTASPQVPNYWHMEYVTGFCKTPSDLYNFIGMLAAINIFYLMGDIILGKPGIASQSIGIDGLSQSNSAHNMGYGNRIKGYLQLMNGVNGKDGMKERLYNYYKGFTISCF
jgi:hypothetical protein